MESLESRESMFDFGVRIVPADCIALLGTHILYWCVSYAADS